ETACTEVLLADFSGRRFAPVGNGNLAVAAIPHPVVIHSEDLEEYFAVTLRIVRCRHQHADDRRPRQDQRLAAPPLAESRQRLTIVGLSFLVRLRRQPGDGELGFDKGRRHFTRQRARESWEWPSNSRRARGDMPSPFTNGLSASAARSALRQPSPRWAACPVVATVMVNSHQRSSGAKASQFLMAFGMSSRGASSTAQHRMHSSLPSEACTGTGLAALLWYF